MDDIKLNLGRKNTENLQSQIDTLTNQLTIEQKRTKINNRNSKKLEKSYENIENQRIQTKLEIEELTKLAEKLTAELIKNKKLAGEKEVEANENLRKFREMSVKVEEEEERADLAERRLSKIGRK